MLQINEAPDMVLYEIKKMKIKETSKMSFFLFDPERIVKAYDKNKIKKLQFDLKSLRFSHNQNVSMEDICDQAHETHRLLLTAIRDDAFDGLGRSNALTFLQLADVIKTMTDSRRDENQNHLQSRLF